MCCLLLLKTITESMTRSLWDAHLGCASVFPHNRKHTLPLDRQRTLPIIDFMVLLAAREITIYSLSYHSSNLQCYVML